MLSHNSNKALTMPPKPLFVIVRPGLEKITANGELIAQPGSIVPLIPADLLPPWVAIEGMPRNLTPEQTTGMINLGSFHRESEGYRLRFLQDSNEEEAQQPQDQGEDDTDASTTSLSEPSEPSLSQKPHVEEVNKPSPSIKPPPRMSQGLASSRHNPLNNIQTPSPPPHLNMPKPRLSTDPKYCRHWCHHGTCKWGISCRFEHTMPTTLDGLCSVGLPDIPNWWRAVMAAGMQSGGIPVRKAVKKNRQKRLHIENLRMVVDRPVTTREEGEDAVASVTEENLIDV